MTTNEIGEFQIIAKCSKTRARASTYKLYHGIVSLPTFMPVATKAAMKGVLSSQLDEEIILGNTYHCRNLNIDLHDFMNYKKCMLTDSGGFQIVSLKDATVFENGVIFPNLSKDGKEAEGMTLMTPEKSIEIQNKLGADIIMQLDDVLNPMQPREKIKIGMERSLRWLKRCYSAHKNKKQILFPIVQGGLHLDLRKESISGIMLENPKGIAIGGLSGGEDKKEFCKVVLFCASKLPENIPKYVMGVGYPEDILVCIALGADMSDCVYPTRTARFGRAMTDYGDINLLKNTNLFCDQKIDEKCECFTCLNHKRDFIYSLKGTSNFCSLISIHNIFYMKSLTKRIRESIIEDRFDVFIKEFCYRRYKDNVPLWIKNVFKEFHISV